ncbi:MAG: lactate utilization protein [Pseudomonadota bacterium]
MSARDRILSKLSRTLTAGVAPEERVAAVDERLTGAGEPRPRPDFATLDGPARIDQFVTRLEAVDGTVSRLDALDDLPEALADQLRQRNLPAAIRHGQDPMFQTLDWGPVEASEGVGRIDEPATLSRAQMGMAETGTLVLASGPDNPVTLTFLGETHFVVLRESDVCAGFEDMWAAVRERSLHPRTLNMVTGPSRSADIGQVLQLGAHGPVALHVFLVKD